MWTAANFIIEGRMRSYGLRLCTVSVHQLLITINDYYKSCHNACAASHKQLRGLGTFKANPRKPLNTFNG